MTVALLPRKFGSAVYSFVNNDTSNLLESMSNDGAYA
jgi:hypothetical protein